MKRMAIKSKFQLGAACILLLFCGGVSWVAYSYLKKVATKEIYQDTEIFIATADATRTYVKDVLRPTVSGLIPKDSFIPHAMSTTFVGREIMGRLKERFPDFKYKRAAANPTNPVNQADAFELSMLEWFNDNPETNEWHGLIQKNNRSFYTRLRAITATDECLRCHGMPEDAPRDMKELYGMTGGYGYKTGEVVAADTIYIPVDVTFVRIKEAAWLVFLIAITSLFGLLGLFYLLFNRTVVFELKGLLGRFRSISPAGNPVSGRPAIRSTDEFEQLKGAFEHVADELKQTHDNLSASESKYRLLFETSRDAILIFDRETRMQDINEAGLKLFLFKDREEALSIETFYQLFWDTRDAKSFYQTIKEKGFVQGLEVLMVDRSGRKLTVMVSATVRLDENHHFSGIDGTFRDITEKRRLEKYLAQTEKLAAIGQLASGVAHEINNPLGVIQCYSSLISKGQEADTQVMKDVEVIQKHTEQCKSVVEALLNFARVSEPQKSHTDIKACIGEVLSVIEPQLQKNCITIQKELDDNISQLIVDAQKIQQVLMNLILNAQQAMPDGGQMTVRTFVQLDMLAVEIADTGIGISEKNIDRIFDPFFTTKDAGRGTGLGLSVSYGIIEQHGGKIEVASSPGDGSNFKILLPLDDSAGEELENG